MHRILFLSAFFLSPFSHQAFGLDLNSPLNGKMNVEVVRSLEFLEPSRPLGSGAEFYYHLGQQFTPPYFLFELKDTYCNLFISYDDIAFMEYLKSGKYPELVLAPTTLSIASTNELIEYDPVTWKPKVRSVHFLVNADPSEAGIKATGAPLQRLDGKSEGKGLLHSINCSGNDLKVIDLQEQLGKSLIGKINN